ncbi:MAG: glycosyltransferase [Alistipes senegalensis]|nr:glycosyltransferase [Oxalobacter formigenes]MCM1281562.1 glycosyltransferase [Alistipes senegalensis]
MSLISVIVPVYNVAPYLRRCLDSLCAQMFSDIEII